MDLILLRAFVAVARAGNLTRAALQLHLTQPAVSLQIKALQESLALRLFTRTSHGLTLTRDGQALLPVAERALAAAREVERTAAALTHTVHGHLRMGTIIDPEFLRLGDFLRRFVESYPEVDIALRHGMSGSILEQIDAGELDVGYYIGRPADERYRWITLAPFHYCVIAPAGWDERLAHRDWRALAELPWVWTPRASVHHRLLSQIFAAHGVTPKKVAEVDQETSMLELVKSGVGLSLARDAIALREAHAHGLAIAEHLVVPTELTFVALAGRADDPAIAAAFTLVEQQWLAGQRLRLSTAPE